MFPVISSVSVGTVVVKAHQQKCLCCGERGETSKEETCCHGSPTHLSCPSSTNV